MSKLKDLLKGKQEPGPAVPACELTLCEAETMAYAWQDLTNPATGQPYVKSFSFNRVDFAQILATPGVEKVKIYPALKSDGTIHLLAVGADINNNDFVSHDANFSGVYDFACPCPNTCGSSPLYKGQDPERECKCFNPNCPETE